MLSVEAVFACFNAQGGRLNIKGALGLEAMVGGLDGIGPA